ncbi:MAG: OadG family protein [Oscillospiraceae bacterium]|nr:OadG family protein [Oscillospiraceae bacterium]
MYITLAALADKVLKGTEKLDGTQITAMTIIGLSVVFFALLILVIFLYTSGSFFKAAKSGQKPAAETKKQAPAKAAPAAAKPAAKPAAPKAAAPAEDESEVVAVIMAAIAAMGAADGKQYRIKSVRPVSGGSGRSAWAQAGIAELTRPF